MGNDYAMSAKHQLHRAVDALPDSLTVEEAVEQLHQVFKLKDGKVRQEQKAPLEPLPVLEGSVPTGWKDAIYDGQ